MQYCDDCEERLARYLEECEKAKALYAKVMLGLIAIGTIATLTVAGWVFS